MNDLNNEIRREVSLTAIARTLLAATVVAAVIVPAFYEKAFPQYALAFLRGTEPAFVKVHASAPAIEPSFAIKGPASALATATEVPAAQMAVKICRAISSDPRTRPDVVAGCLTSAEHDIDNLRMWIDEVEDNPNHLDRRMQTTILNYCYRIWGQVSPVEFSPMAECFRSLEFAEREFQRAGMMKEPDNTPLSCRLKAIVAGTFTPPLGKFTNPPDKFGPMPLEKCP